jgi:hypothetical protein
MACILGIVLGALIILITVVSRFCHWQLRADPRISEYQTDRAVVVALVGVTLIVVNLAFIDC